MNTQDMSWIEDGKCYDLPKSNLPEDQEVYESFFEDRPVDRKLAQAFCEGCPVQKKCLKYALETNQLYGVWGGRDESEIRRDLWVHSNGTVGSRARNPRCAWCREDSSTLTIKDRARHIVECSSCGFSWRAESSALGVEYLETTGEVTTKYRD